MSQRSSIDRLDPSIRTEVDAALKRGATIDEIVWMLKGLGQDVSRSAVGRYSKRYADLAARQRDLSSIAQAFAGEFGDAEDRQGRLLIQLVTSLATRAIMPIAAGDKVELDGKDLHFLARAVKDITSASKTDVDREAKIREEAFKTARRQAAEAAETGAREAGASDEVIEKVKRRILGLSGEGAGA